MLELFVVLGILLGAVLFFISLIMFVESSDYKDLFISILIFILSISSFVISFNISEIRDKEEMNKTREIIIMVDDTVIFKSHFKGEEFTPSDKIYDTNNGKIRILYDDVEENKGDDIK